VEEQKKENEFTTLDSNQSENKMSIVKLNKNLWNVELEIEWNLN
jgi:hypothetical protein